MNKKVLFFDLDGTIIDTIVDITAALNRALKAYGYGERTVSEVKSFLGNGSLMLCRRAMNVFDNDELCLEFRSFYQNEYDSDMYSGTKPYDGILEILRELRDMGLKIVVLSNKDDRNVVPMIDYYFGDLVDISRGVRTDTDRKPNPEVTLSILESVGASVEEALFIGDGTADLQVSAACGMDFLPVGYGYFPVDVLEKESGKKAVMSVPELRDAILKYLN